MEVSDQLQDEAPLPLGEIPSGPTDGGGGGGTVNIYAKDGF
jgi:hypothetical protein